MALLLSVPATLATPSPPACPDGATAVSNATWGGACFSLSEQRATSLRQCVEWCGEQGMTPACIGSAEENAFAAGLVPDDDWAIIGHYQNDTSGGVDEGWGRCVAGEASEFANWDQEVFPQPDDYYGPEDFAVMTGRGRWRDEWSGPTIRTYRCLCEGPFSPSDAFQQDLQVMEAALEAGLNKERARAAVLFPVCLLITFLPAVLLLFHRRHRGHSARAEGQGGAAGPQSSQARTALRAARRSAAQRRLRVSGLMAQSGWAFFVFGLAPSLMLYSGHQINAIVGPHSFWVIMVVPGAFLLLLALLPTDSRAIRTLCAVCFALFAGAGVLVPLATLFFLPPTFAIPFAVLCLATAAGLGPTLLRHGPRALQPRLALRRLWLVVRLTCLAFAVFFIGGVGATIAAEPSEIGEPNTIGGPPFLCASFILCALLATPANRGRLHRRLGRLGGNSSEEEEAAAISALVAGADPDTALADAAKLFRCLRASRFATEDLAGSGLKGPSASPSAVVATTAEALAAKTEPAKLGEVTCFLSHSWRDEDAAPGEKYRAFARWAREQEEATGKEPTLWLDKACIDQNNIDQALACLPIFLSGCQILLIVAGPTYCSRLWCVMEIFTFMRMGGARDRIDVELIAHPDQDQAAAKKELTAQLATFNAAKAECFMQEDRQRLLAVIEAGFGNFDDFNQGVRTTFDQRMRVQRVPSRGQSVTV